MTQTDNKVLIVSEEVVSRRILTGLESGGYHTEVSSMSNCTASITKFNPDIILLLNLDNQELETIKTIKDFCETPMVVSSQIPLTEKTTLIKFAGIEVVNTFQTDALIVNKLKICLRLRRIKEIAEDLLKIQLDKEPN